MHVCVLNEFFVNKNILMHCREHFHTEYNVNPRRFVIRSVDYDEYSKLSPGNRIRAGA